MTIVSRTDDLEILLAVVDCGGFSVAARRLDLQIARVSRAVTRLEKELDCTLLNRTTRQIDLTEEGRLFISAIRDGLGRLAEAEDLLHTLKGSPSGRLRVDAATPFILHQMIPLMAGFRSTYPDIQLELISNENIIDLIERRTDIAIRIGAPSDSNLHARQLGRSPVHIVASPDYFACEGQPASVDDLSRHQLIRFTDSPTLNRWPLQTPLTIQPTLSASSGETIRQLCLAGQGIALLSGFMINDDLKNGRLIELFDRAIISPNSREQVQAMYYRHTALSSRISAFLDYIQPHLSL